MAVLLASVLPAASEPAYHSPLDLRFSPDGEILAVGDATGERVNLLHVRSNKPMLSVPVGASPSGLAWSADGKGLFVAASGAGHVAEIRVSDGTVIRRMATGRYPRGLAAASRRNLLLACDWGLDRLHVIGLADGKSVANIPVGCQPTCVAVSPDESLAVVSHLIPATAANDPKHASEITIVDLEKLAVRKSVRLPTGSSNARGIAIGGDGRTAYVVHTLGRFHLPTTQLDRGWVNTNAFSVIDLASGELSATILLDQVMKGAADPWGVAIDPEGQRLHITLAGVHQLAVIDLKRLPEILGEDPAALANDLSALHRHGLMRRIDLPAKGPRGIDVSPNDGTIAIAGYFSGSVVLLDENGVNPQSIPLGSQTEPDLVRRGEAAFHDATLCYQNWLSCATCHPGARSDGLNWDLLNDGIGNPKNSRSMLLSHATPPVMSLGVRANMETAVRAGFVHIQFTEPSTEDVEAVIAYFKSLKPVASPHLAPDGSLTASAARGNEVFLRDSVGCAKCHPAPLFTKLGMRDVGTANPQDRGKSKYDTPTLVELWCNPPYLHDGRAATLREVLVDHNANDRHGKVSQLSSAELDDLIEYLMSL
jgi:DNA-binding beta-propeller fold protein YncE